MASFGQFELCLVDINDKPGPLMVFQATNEAPTAGDWITLDGKDCTVLAVQHLAEQHERPPRLRARIYLKEAIPPTYFGRQSPGTSPTPIRPGVRRLVSVPSEQPQALMPDGVIFSSDVITASAPARHDDEKKVRAVRPRDESTSTTVKRALSKSQVNEAFSNALSNESIPPPAPVFIPTGGQPQAIMSGATTAFGVSSGSAAASQAVTRTTRQFELNSRAERPTLQLVRKARVTVPEGLSAPQLIEFESVVPPDIEHARSTHLTTPDAVPTPAVVAEQLRARKRGGFASFAPIMLGIIILAVAVVFLIEAPYRHESTSSSDSQTSAPTLQPPPKRIETPDRTARPADSATSQSSAADREIAPSSASSPSASTTADSGHSPSEESAPSPTKIRKGGQSSALPVTTTRRKHSSLDNEPAPQTELHAEPAQQDRPQPAASQPSRQKPDEALEPSF